MPALRRTDADPHGFVQRAMTNPVNAALLDRLAPLGLRDCFLTAGCLFQASWNIRSGRPAGWGIKDYDVFYFDDRDLSWEAEDAVIQTVRRVTADLGIEVEVRNQARVHLWYEQRFGSPYPRLISSQDGIDRYLVACTCVGLAIEGRGLYAPNGLLDLEQGVLRPNPVNDRPDLFQQKARSYRSRWPWLTIAK